MDAKIGFSLVLLLTVVNISIFRCEPVSLAIGGIGAVIAAAGFGKKGERFCDRIHIFGMNFPCQEVDYIGQL